MRELVEYYWHSGGMDTRGEPDDRPFYECVDVDSQLAELRQQLEQARAERNEAFDHNRRAYLEIGEHLQGDYGMDLTRAMRQFVQSLAHREERIDRIVDERDEHAHWRVQLADALHDRETQLAELHVALVEGVQAVNPVMHWIGSPEREPVVEWLAKASRLNAGTPKGTVPLGQAGA